MDTVSKKRRSEIMRAVKSKETQIEIAFRKKLWRQGFRYSKNSLKYFGKPDIVLTKYKTAIFIDSCFWHGCKLHCRLPEQNRTYWKKKIQGNRIRDRLVTKTFKKTGWTVVRLWEHQLNKDSDKAISKLTSLLKLNGKKVKTLRVYTVSNN